MKYSREFLQYMRDHADDFEEMAPEQFRHFALGHFHWVTQLGSFLYTECDINPFEYFSDLYRIGEMFKYNSEITDFEVLAENGNNIVPYDMFRGCSSLTNVIINNGIEEIGTNAFSNSGIEKLRCPSTLKIIHRCAFRNCSNLKSVTFNDDVEQICERAFEGCLNLTSVTIPAKCKRISGNAFLNCEKLSSVTIEDGVKQIGDYAFVGCPNLTVIELPQTINYIENQFAGEWGNGYIKGGKVKFKIRGLNKEEARIWADSHIVFGTKVAKDVFLRKLV